MPQSRFAVADPALGVHHALPGKLVQQDWRQVEEGVTGQPRVTRQTGPERNLTISGNLTARDQADSLVDQLMLAVRTRVRHNQIVNATRLTRLKRVRKPPDDLPGDARFGLAASYLPGDVTVESQPGLSTPLPFLLPCLPPH